jgi:replicative DNA helicase
MVKRRTFLKSGLAGVFPFLGLPSIETSGCIEKIAPYPERFERAEDTNGILTGFTDLDFKLSSYEWNKNGMVSTQGISRSDFVLLAGCSAMGKTAFAMNIVRNLVVDQKTSVSIFSLGASKLWLEAFLLCSLAKVNIFGLKVGYLREDEKIRLQKAASLLRNAPFFIDDTPCLSVSDIKERILGSKPEFRPGLVIIDDLQLIHDDGNSKINSNDLHGVAKSLNFLAKGINIPIIALLNVDNIYLENGDYDKMPCLTDLRVFGKIEQETDVILFIHKHEDEPELSNVIVAQNRDGNTGIVSLAFDRSFARFDNLAAFG